MVENLVLVYPDFELSNWFLYIIFFASEVHNVFFIPLSDNFMTASETGALKLLTLKFEINEFLNVLIHYSIHFCLDRTFIVGFRIICLEI